MKIELLYFDGCRNYPTVLRYLQEILREKNLDIPVEMVEIKSDDEAIKHRFTGSPTVKINGRDIVPQESEDFSMGCRMYLDGDEITELPGKKTLRHAIEQAIQGNMN